MIIKMKSWTLKKGFRPEELEKYGFEKNYCGNYTRDVNGLDYVIYYRDSQRFVLRTVCWREGRARKVGKYIADLRLLDLVEKKPYYEWWAIVGSWRNYSDRKLERIEERVDKLNSPYLRKEEGE